MTTELLPIQSFWNAEDYHQKYLVKKSKWILSYKYGASTKLSSCKRYPEKMKPSIKV